MARGGGSVSLFFLLQYDSVLGVVLFWSFVLIDLL
jgi:hypothetical protein